MNSRVFILIIIILMAPRAALAAAGVALVVGVGEFNNAPNLENPSHDAKVVAGALTAAGFEL